MKVAWGEVCLPFEEVGLLLVWAILEHREYLKDSLVVTGEFELSMGDLGEGLHF